MVLSRLLWQLLAPVCTAVDAVMAGKVRHNAALSKDCLIILELANIV